MSRIQIKNLSNNSMQELKQENQELDAVRGGFGANLAFFDIGKEGSTLGLAFASA